MLSPNELKKGDLIIINNQPSEIIETSRLFKGRGHSVIQARVKNLITGVTTSETFHPSDSFQEAEIKKIKAKFLYSHLNQFFFSEEKNSSKRFILTREQLGPKFKFLKPNQIVEGLIFEEKIINISLPIKMIFKVIEAPPGVQGSRAQPGTKMVILETGAQINTPLFIEEGDIVEINTETGEYVRRIEK